MNRLDTLNKANHIVNGQSEDGYWSPETSFATIASLWSVYLGHEVLAHDVAAMMTLLNIARVRDDPKHSDSWVDMAAQAACGAECAAKTDPKIYERITGATPLPYADTTPSEVDPS